MSAYHVMQGFAEGFAAAVALAKEQRNAYMRDYMAEYRGGRKRPVVDYSGVEAMYASGMTMRQIAAALGVSLRPVHVRLQASGLSRPRGGKRETSFVVGVTSRGNASKEARIGRAN